MSSASSSNRVSSPNNDSFEIVYDTTSVDEAHPPSLEALANRVAKLEEEVRNLRQERENRNAPASSTSPQRSYEKKCSGCSAIIEIVATNLRMVGEQRKLRCPTCRTINANSHYVYKARDPKETK